MLKATRLFSLSTTTHATSAIAHGRSRASPSGRPIPRSLHRLPTTRSGTKTRGLRPPQTPGPSYFSVRTWCLQPKPAIRLQRTRMGFLSHLFWPWGILLQVLAIVHFIRRRPDQFWIWVILFLGPIGAVV